MGLELITVKLHPSKLLEGQNMRASFFWIVKSLKCELLYILMNDKKIVDNKKKIKILRDVYR